MMSHWTLSVAALAVFSLEPLVAMIPEGFDIPRLDHVSIDLPVLGFAMGLALATGLLFGLGPAQHGRMRPKPACPPVCLD